jgi:hypothetical protein
MVMEASTEIIEILVHQLMLHADYLVQLADRGRRIDLLRIQSSSPQSFSLCAPGMKEK